MEGSRWQAVNGLQAEVRFRVARRFQWLRHQRRRSRRRRKALFCLSIDQGERNDVPSFQTEGDPFQNLSFVEKRSSRESISSGLLNNHLKWCLPYFSAPATSDILTVNQCIQAHQSLRGKSSCYEARATQALFKVPTKNFYSTEWII